MPRISTGMSVTSRRSGQLHCWRPCAGEIPGQALQKQFATTRRRSRSDRSGCAAQTICTSATDWQKLSGYMINTWCPKQYPYDSVGASRPASPVTQMASRSDAWLLNCLTRNGSNRYTVAPRCPCITDQRQRDRVVRAAHGWNEVHGLAIRAMHTASQLTAALQASRPSDFYASGRVTTQPTGCCQRFGPPGRWSAAAWVCSSQQVHEDHRPCGPGLPGVHLPPSKGIDA